MPITPDKNFRIVSAVGCPGHYVLAGYFTDELTADCNLDVKFDADIVDPIIDPGLKTAVKNALGLTEDDALTAQKMWALEQLYLGDNSGTKNVFSVHGLQYAKNLSFLTINNLRDSKVTNTSPFDLSPLVDLTNLESLTVNNTHTRDLKPLSGLKNLKFLYMAGGDFTDISPIVALKKLKNINFEVNNISDLSALKDVDNLDSLSLSRNLFDTNQLAILKGKKIGALELSFNRIENLEFLRGNMVLRVLNITGTLVSSLDPLLDTGIGGQDSALYTEITCLVYSNNKHLRDVYKKLTQRGVGIVDTPSDFVYESDKNPTRLVTSCPARSIKIDASVQASYQANGDIDINWAVTGDVTNRKFNCAIFAGIEKQQLREPLVNIDDCVLVGSKNITGFTYTNEDIHFILSDGFGIHKDILIKPTPILPAGPVIQAIDWGQSIVSANPRLVPNRDALLRVHVVATTATPVPDVQIELLLAGQSKIIAMQKPAQLPAVKHYQTLTDNYSVVVPKDWVKSGLSIKVTLQGQEPRLLNPVINEPTGFYLTIVPIDILGAVAELPSQTDIQTTLSGFWPVSDVKTRIHPVFKSKVTTGAGMWSLLFEIEELRAVENEASYYYGFFSHKLYSMLTNIPYAGIADLSNYSAVGLDDINSSGYLPVWASTMLHEMGHNFGLNHVNCGSPFNYDSGYPYAVETIGSLGISADLKNLYLPERYDAGGYADVMSYCWPQHISDYSFIKAQDYLELHPPKPFISVAAESVLKKKPNTGENKSIYISGEIDTAGVVALRRIIPLHQPAIESVMGDYQIKIFGENAEEIVQSFNMINLDHATSGSPQFFSVKIPWIEIASIEIFHKGQPIFKKAGGTVGERLQKLSTLISAVPKLHESGSSVCVEWSKLQYNSASLLLQKGDAASVVFMDNDSGNLCAPTTELPISGAWHLLLRNGLSVKEMTFTR